MQVEEEQSTPAEMASLWTVMKMNASEWWQIFVGCISSLIMGGAMPIFAVLFGEIIGVGNTLSIAFMKQYVSDLIYILRTSKQFTRKIPILKYLACF